MQVNNCPSNDNTYKQVPAIKNLIFKSGDGLIIPFLFTDSIAGITFEANIYNDVGQVASFDIVPDGINPLLIRLKLSNEISSTLLGNYTWSFSWLVDGFLRTLVEGTCKAVI
ncbi:MAG: hypothetical protein ABSG25_15085 [Bryobacteraceae bacterium]